MSKKLICGDALAYLEGMTEKVSCIFADPPDNYGVDYIDNEEPDYLPYYAEWIESIVKLALERCNFFWLSLNHGYILQLGTGLKSLAYRHQFLT